MSKHFLIIQARMGSSRLPGKVLMSIEGEPLIKRMYNRLSASEQIDEVLIATTDQPTDDSLVEYLEQNGIKSFRGSEDDVLDRYYQAAKSLNPEREDAIVRICADNPLHHKEVLDFVLGRFDEGGYDYFSNSNYEPDFLEDGYDVEVFRYWLLEKAWAEATLASDREHVCPFMKKPDEFKCGWEKYRKDYHYKLSVDTENDMRAVAEIYKSLYPSNHDFGIDEVMQLVSERPEILELNKDSVINAGYHKSLKDD